MTTLDGNPASKLIYLEKPGAKSENEGKYAMLAAFKDNMRYTVIHQLT